MSDALHWRARRKLLQGIVDTVRASIKPPPRLNLVEWADEYRYLPDNSAEAGRWRTDRVEAARAPMLSITEKGVQEVTVMSCIQLMKALWIDTPIPTPKGWSTMGDLKVGDLVYGSDGKQYPVLAKSDVKTANRCFQVQFSDGTSVVADAGHKWQVVDKYGVKQVLNTLEILDDYYDSDYHIEKASPLEHYNGKTAIERAKQIYEIVGDAKDDYVFDSESEADALAELIRSLGGSVLRNNVSTKHYLHFANNSHYISMVREIDPVPVQCIAVGSPDHLYLCGEGMIPTHNTELMINTALYYIHQEPSPIMYIAPKKETAEAWSKERFMKSINTTPVTKEIFSNNRRGEGNTILQKQFAGGQISIVSARNPTDLAMRACRIMLFDEVDKYPINAGSGDGGEGGEGDPISIAWGRATTYGKRAKKIVACSPTVEGRSRVHQEYLASDQREFYQPCPHCNHAEPLDWFKHVIIPENSVTKELDASRAAIVCVNCGTEWTEGDRLKSIRNGYWVAKKPDITHHHGYKVSSLASPFTPIRMLAQEYAKAIGNPQALKAFVNTRLADVYQEKGEVPDWERLYERREAYAHGTVPDGGLLIVAGIDVQKDYLIYEVVAYGRKKRSWSIDIGTIDGHISEDRTKEELSKFLETRYLNSQGNYVGIELALIDSSNDTQEVYSTVYKINTPRLRAIKGVASLTTIVGNPKPVQININGIRKDGGVKMYPLGVSVIKEQFYKWLMLSRPTDEAIAEGATYPTGYCHFPEWGEDYFKQITAEILVDKSDNKGYLVREWKRIRDHNHFLDCRVYARAASAMLGIDRFSENEWLERESRYGKTEDRAIESNVIERQEVPKQKARVKRKRPSKFFGKQ